MEDLVKALGTVGLVLIGVALGGSVMAYLHYAGYLSEMEEEEPVEAPAPNEEDDWLPNNH